MTAIIHVDVEIINVHKNARYNLIADIYAPVMLVTEVVIHMIVETGIHVKKHVKIMSAKKVVIKIQVMIIVCIHAENLNALINVYFAKENAFFLIIFIKS